MLNTTTDEYAEQISRYEMKYGEPKMKEPPVKRKEEKENEG